MKTHLLYDAIDQLSEIANLGAEQRAAVDEIADGGVLIDCGSMLNTDLFLLNGRQRRAYFKRVAKEGLMPERRVQASNLVFVFAHFMNRGRDIDCLVHAVDVYDGWRLRAIGRSPDDSYTFCPFQGHLDYDLSGVKFSPWALGNMKGGTKRWYQEWLLDMAMTGFARMRRPMTARQAENRRLPMNSAMSSAWAAQAIAGNAQSERMPG